MAVNTSPGASSEENQSTSNEIAASDKPENKSDKWNHDTQYSSPEDDQKGSDNLTDVTDPALFGEGGAGEE
ncbi:hypothetical protein [Deinococcus roseus]|uniref:Uncharacterized protein n=1 Tax=Deinococcus roseus TaxID=392414 RepID=A0ABQ2DBM7_9DEIO|nr:hypothetical protein [Deinococcus roseus]GGJ50501.1 hypothetical protein GCM10008938_40540 [Deinococcus roseus]